MGWLISKALMQDYENSRCSLGREGESLAGTCSDGAQSVPSNTNHIQQAYCSPDRMTEYSRLSRFGMMYEPLTAGRGEDLLIWYLADSHAKTSALQAKALGWMARGQDSGQKWRGSLAKYDHDTHLLKTAQCSLFGDSTEYSATLPRSGTMRSGAVYQREKLAHHTIEIEHGLSQERFPTPTVCGDYNRKGASKTSGDGLVTYVMKYPTPTARDYKGARSDEAMEATGRNQETNSLPDYLASIGERGQMNPVFREWLMGWPLTHTDLRPQETAKFQEWQQQHSISWRED
jgi:hypothetical protein